MALYTSKQVIEAYKVGTEPVPVWFTDAMLNGDVNTRGPLVMVGCASGWAVCVFGDYIVYKAPLTDDDGNVIEPRQFSIVGADKFESLYQLADVEQPAVVVEPPADVLFEDA